LNNILACHKMSSNLTVKSRSVNILNEIELSPAKDKNLSLYYFLFLLFVSSFLFIRDKKDGLRKLYFAGMVPNCGMEEFI